MHEKERNRILAEAIKRREEFLKEYPQFHGYQAEIDRILTATPKEQRLEVLMDLMLGKISEMLGMMNEIAKQKEED